MKTNARFKTSLLAAALALFATPSVYADDVIYLNAGIGYQFLDSDRNLDDGLSYHLGAEYRFLPQWAAAVVGNWMEADVDGGKGDRDFKAFRLDGLYYFNATDLADREAFEPYLAFGAGRAITDLPNANDHETRLNAGGGVRYNVTDRLSITGDLRQFYALDTENKDTQVALGFSLAFPHTSRAPVAEAVPAPAPVVAAPVAVAAPVVLDSDGDGVKDDADLCPNTRAGAKVDAKGCEGVKERVETIRLNVRFATASAAIVGTYNSEIQQVADFMQRYPDTSVEIAGHTDSVGSDKYNEGLSDRRANAVAQRLISAFGIDAARVSAKGYGEAQPIADNTTATGRAENRRVEARIEKVVK